MSGEHPKGREAIRKVTEYNAKQDPRTPKSEHHRRAVDTARRHFQRESAEGRKG